ncbi:MAG TPA: SDR family NAD(P)-dependent oxidoreductase [Verrucomicrobiae bacterium]|nr:SDR family NAD(P)-dependent oxidoreductase [Verrucomicrobiae bacterium]
MKRWALITGASQDIGLEFAKLFAANGWNMALIARDKPRLEKIAGELRASYGTK